MRDLEIRMGKGWRPNPRQYAIGADADPALAGSTLPPSARSPIPRRRRRGPLAGEDAWAGELADEPVDPLRVASGGAPCPPAPS